MIGRILLAGHYISFTRAIDCRYRRKLRPLTHDTAAAFLYQYGVYHADATLMILRAA